MGGDYAYQIHDSVAAHDRIRRLMREKYGWRDWWISAVFDTSGSQMVEIEAR